MTKARKKVALTIGEAAEARREAVAAREVAKVVKDMAVATADDAQDIGLQAGFKVLRQALLQIAPHFGVKALDTLVTMDMINTAILEAKAEHRPG